ncbi:MAG: Gfo/Idh/MocA family oxidoreductase [Actinomycetota bacterium]|nr:Gfo/Idh/MocA family oxidoreductase [Actinomycetota bacterium]
MAKIIILGAGFMGQTHANAYKDIEGAEIVAIVDKNAEKGKKLAQEYGAKFYEDVDECLQKEDSDCVDVCLPTFLHLEMTQKAADAGKNVLCEKPIALSLEQADKMIEAINKNKVKGMIGHVLRFWPEYVKVKELVDSGELGQSLYGFCQRLAVTPDWYENDWGLSEKNSGGVPLDLSIHDLDYLIWLMGEPSIVKAQGVFNPKMGGIVNIATNIEFKNGKSGFAEGGWAYGGEFPFTMVLRVLCEKGTIDWLFRAGKNIEQRGQKSLVNVYENSGKTYTLDVEDTDAYSLECKYFVECINNNRPIENATFEDGRKAIELALAAKKSDR